MTEVLVHLSHSFAALVQFNQEEKTSMSVNEIQALAQKFAAAFDRRDIKTVLNMLSDDVEVFDTAPYRFDGKPLFAKFLDAAFGSHPAACTTTLWDIQCLRHV
jgi:ketosteroid isomerase-like protein